MCSHLGPTLNYRVLAMQTIWILTAQPFETTHQCFTASRTITFIINIDSHANLVVWSHIQYISHIHNQRNTEECAETARMALHAILICVQLCHSWVMKQVHRWLLAHLKQKPKYKGGTLGCMLACLQTLPTQPVGQLIFKSDLLPECFCCSLDVMNYTVMQCQLVSYLNSVHQPLFSSLLPGSGKDCTENHCPVLV